MGVVANEDVGFLNLNSVVKWTSRCGDSSYARCESRTSVLVGENNKDHKQSAYVLNGEYNYKDRARALVRYTLCRNWASRASICIDSDDRSKIQVE